MELQRQVPRKRRAFVCYSHLDQVFFKELCDWLSQRNVEPSTANLMARLNGNSTLFANMSMAEFGDAAIVVLSENFKNDDWLPKELNALLAQEQKGGIPVCLLMLAEIEENDKFAYRKEISISKPLCFFNGKEAGFRALETRLNDIYGRIASPIPVFISHSQRDEAVYSTLCMALDAAGTTRWNPLAMSPGDSLADQLKQAISKCDVCIFVATRRSIESQWCLAELGAFWGAGKRVVIFVVDPDLEETKLPPQFKGNLTVNDANKLINAVRQTGREVV